MAGTPWSYEVIASPEQSDTLVRYLIENNIQFDVIHEGDSE